MKRPEFSMIYAIYWPQHEVLKVGRCSKSYRWRELALSGGGGEVIFLMRDVPTRWEYCILAHLDEFYFPAFKTADESEIVLPRGRGYTECYKVPKAQKLEALYRMYDGIQRFGYVEAEGSETGNVQEGGTVAVASSCEVGGDRSKNVCGRSGPGEGEPASDVSGTVSIESGNNGTDDDRVPSDVGRSGESDSVRCGRVNVLSDFRVAKSGPCPAVEVPRSPCLGQFTNISKLNRERLAIKSRIIRGFLVAGERGRRGGEFRGKHRGKPWGRRRERNRGRQFAIPSRSTVTILRRTSPYRDDCAMSGVRERPPDKESLG